MATIRLTVQLGSAALPDTVANAHRMFVYGGVSPVTSTTAIAGNIGSRMSRDDRAYDLNRPRIPGAICVTSYQPQRFASTDLAGKPELADAIARTIEAGFVEALDLSAAIAGQTGATAAMAAASGGFITVTGLTGMVDPDSLGHFLTISGAATVANNGTFEIVRYNSATSVDIVAGAAPGGDANNASLTWTELGDVMDRLALEAYL